MKRILYLLIIAGFLLGCEKTDVSLSDSEKVHVGCSYNGRTLHVGPKGGCYYNNANGNKTYVDRSYCYCK